MRIPTRTRHVGLLAGTAAATLLLSACLMRLIVGSEYYTDDVGEFIGNIFADVSTALCRRDPMGTGVTCRYSIEEGGGLRTSTSTAELISELGVVGVIIDPMILELPAATRNIRGTYRDGAGNEGDLLVYPNLTSVPADDTRNFVAGPGRQLVVVDLPSGLPIDGVDYSFSLAYERPATAGSAPTDIKAILTGKLELGGKTFYPPFLPCSTDFASIESFTLPQTQSASDAPRPVSLPSDPAVCQNERYFYFFAESFNLPCDLDNDTDVDAADLALIMRARNVDNDPGDPRDIDDDGRIDANDARSCVRTCTRPRCAV